jgi:hypothetical protein
MIAFLVLVLVGCSSMERLDSASVSELGQISVSTSSSRSGQIFQQHIMQYLDRYPAQDIRYRLTAKISESKSDTAVSMTVRYDLYDQQEGKVLISDSIGVSATFGAVSSLYGQDKAATFASERLDMQLSDKVYLKLLAYFNNLNHAETASAQ